VKRPSLDSHDLCLAPLTHLRRLVGSVWGDQVGEPRRGESVAVFLVQAKAPPQHPRGRLVRSSTTTLGMQARPRLTHWQNRGSSEQQIQSGLECLSGGGDHRTARKAQPTSCPSLGWGGVVVQGRGWEKHCNFHKKKLKKTQKNNQKTSEIQAWSC
jgi:hypothetical protein